MMAARVRELFRRERVPETLYHLALAVWFVATVLDTSFFAPYVPYRYLRFGCFAVLIACELAKGRYTRRSIFALGLAALVLFANLDSSYSLIDITLFAVVGRSFDHKKTARICLVSILATVALVIASADLGIITNHVETGGNRVREFLGFRYMLFPSQYAFAIICLVSYLRSERFSWAELAFCVGLSVYMYGRTISRLSLLLSVGTAFATFVFAFVVRQRRGRHLRTPKWAAALGAFVAVSTLVCALASVAITVAFDSSVGWMASIDEFTILSGRLRYGQEAVQKYGIPLLGQHISLVGNGLEESGTAVATGAYNWVDCMYVRILVEDGLLVSVIVVALATMVGWHAWKTRDVGLMVAVVACAGHGILDELCFSLEFNPLLLLAGLPFADGNVVDRSFPRMARVLPGDEEDALSAGESFALLGRSWRPIVVSAVVCALLAWGYTETVPVRYRAVSRLKVSTKVIPVEGIARRVVDEADTDGMWLHAGANVASGSVFITAQGEDESWCEELSNRTLRLTDLYISKDAGTSKVKSTPVPVKDVEVLLPHSNKLIASAAGVGICGAVMYAATTGASDPRERGCRADVGDE